MFVSSRAERRSDIWISAKGGDLWPVFACSKEAYLGGKWAMRQTPEAVQQNLAERLCGQAAYRDDSRVARRLVAQASRHRRHRAPPHPDPGPGALGVCAGRGVRCRGGACQPVIQSRFKRTACVGSCPAFSTCWPGVWPDSMGPSGPSGPVGDSRSRPRDDLHRDDLQNEGTPAATCPF